MSVDYTISVQMEVLNKEETSILHIYQLTHYLVSITH